MNLQQLYYFQAISRLKTIPKPQNSSWSPNPA